MLSQRQVGMEARGGILSILRYSPSNLFYPLYQAGPYQPYVADLSPSLEPTMKQEAVQQLCKSLPSQWNKTDLSLLLLPFLFSNLPHCFFWSLHTPIACLFNGNRAEQNSLLAGFLFLWRELLNSIRLPFQEPEATSVQWFILRTIITVDFQHILSPLC